MSADSLAQQLAELQAENESLRSQLSEPDLKAFEQIRELRSANKKLADDVKRLTGESVQLAFKNRGLEQQVKKLQEELGQAAEQGQRLHQSMEELQGELSQSREQVLSHEQELERQKAALSQGQASLHNLQEELRQREERIAKLEHLVNDFKEQFLSGDFAAVAEPPSAEGAYALLQLHLGEALGLSGQTLVDQVYDLMGVDHSSDDMEVLEDLFECLQDTGEAVFSSPEEQAVLKQSLQRTWGLLSGQPSLTSTSAQVVEVDSIAEPEPVAELEPAPSAPAEPEVVVEVEPELEPEPPLDAELEPEAEAHEDASAEFQVPELELATEPVPENEPELAAAEEEPAAVEQEPAVEEGGLDLDALLGMGSEEPVVEVEATSHGDAEVVDEVVDEIAEPAAESQSPTGDHHGAWVPPQARAKQEQIESALELVQSQPALALEMLEQALEVEVWVEAEPRAHLAVARLKASLHDIMDPLSEAMAGVEVEDLFPLLSAAESVARGSVAERLGLFYQFGMTSRADMLKLESGVGLGKRSLNRDFVASIGDEVEEQIVGFLRDHLIPKAGLHLPMPSQKFQDRLEATGPAAFVGTLRQALRAVDYTLFNFPDLKVLTYDGPDTFVVDACAEPELTLVFHRDIEGLPPEELCFLVFRHLVGMYRGHSQLAHMAEGLDDAARLRLIQAAVELFLEENAMPHPELQQRLDALQPGPDFESLASQLLLQLYQASNWEGFLYTREFLWQGEVFSKRLNPLADHEAARLVGITAATYGSLRDELRDHEALLEELQHGLTPLFEGKPGLGPARLRLQRLWNSFLEEEQG